MVGQCHSAFDLNTKTLIQILNDVRFVRFTPSSVSVGPKQAGAHKCCHDGKPTEKSLDYSSYNTQLITIKDGEWIH